MKIRFGRRAGFAGSSVSAMPSSIGAALRPSMLFLLSASFALVACQQTKTKLVEKSVLEVNGTKISTQDFAKRLALQLRDYDALRAKDSVNLSRAKEKIIEEYVVENLIEGHARKENLHVSAAEIQTESEKLKSQYPDANSFNAALAAENIDPDAWQGGIRKRLLTSKVVANIAKNLPSPSEVEVKSYFETHRDLFNFRARVKLRQVVVDNEDSARRILKELQGGTSFEKLARQYSIAAESKNGGITDWIEKGVLDVFDQAFKMQIGSRSKILKSPYGFHIYEVVKKEPESKLSLAEARTKILAQLQEKAAQEAFSRWLEDQVRTANVLRNDELIRAITVTTKGT